MDRDQIVLFPEAIDDYIKEDNPVKFIEVFVDSLDLKELGFKYSDPKPLGRPPYNPADMLKLYADSAAAAQAQGLGINAGHDLSLRNLGDFLSAVPNVCEVSIGHALIAEALFMGLADTVKAYLDIVNGR